MTYGKLPLTNATVKGDRRSQPRWETELGQARNELLLLRRMAGVDPGQLHARGLTLAQLLDALERNNANAGGGLLDQPGTSLLVQGGGIVTKIEDIRAIGGALLKPVVRDPNSCGSRNLGVVRWHVSTA
jgi:hypothetical protein